jgi:hypothetical protein
VATLGHGKGCFRRPSVRLHVSDIRRVSRMITCSARRHRGYASNPLSTPIGGSRAPPGLATVTEGDLRTNLTYSRTYRTSFRECWRIDPAWCTLMSVTSPNRGDFTRMRVQVPPRTQDLPSSGALRFGISIRIEVITCTQSRLVVATESSGSANRRNARYAGIFLGLSRCPAAWLWR